MPRPVGKNAVTEPEEETNLEPETTETNLEDVRETVKAELANIEALYDRQNSLREEADGIDAEISEAVARLKVHGTTFKNSATGTVHMIRLMGKSGKYMITGFRETPQRRQPSAIEF